MNYLNEVNSLKSWYDIKYDLDKLPDKCPICNYACEPIPVLSYNRGKNFNDNSEVVFLVCACPRNDCKELFLVRYRKIYYDADMYSLVGYSPFKYKDIIFEECISDISQTFVDIYNQAMKAEKYNLIDIAGVGYRKALEFLIKDYSIKKNPDSKNEIENSFLGKCITTFIKNENIKQCAKRATWIGNDETHYLRKWIDKDISDMRALINLTINWIIMEENTIKYLKEMKN